ncbi:hypothetical protein [Methylovulum sp.]|uniref:hypothetical protein n=1 Tax=Methylovulum sp. TaxID=1916980 RepID=UPI0034368794
MPGDLPPLVTALTINRLHARYATLFKSTDFPTITRKPPEILQVNPGYLCNLSCTHCHVNAGSKRTELMDEATVAT